MSATTSSDDKTPRILVKRNGPYVVAFVTKLTNVRGESIEHEEVYELCRCGGSSNKPFCDDTHKKNGFTDEKNQ